MNSRKEKMRTHSYEKLASRVLDEDEFSRCLNTTDDDSIVYRVSRLSVVQKAIPSSPTFSCTFIKESVEKINTKCVEEKERAVEG